VFHREKTISSFAGSVDWEDSRSLRRYVKRIESRINGWTLELLSWLTGVLKTVWVELFDKPQNETEEIRTRWKYFRDICIRINDREEVIPGFKRRSCYWSHAHALLRNNPGLGP